MIWDDKGFLISKNKYNENSLIAEMFTEQHGKVSGIILAPHQKRLKLPSNWKSFVFKL